MPARKKREGAELQEWLAKREAQKVRQAQIRSVVRELSGHTLLKPLEVAELLATTTKTIRELEARGEFPPRVEIGPMSVGYRLKDIEAFIDARLKTREAA
ncbi:helix-turn-helix transcriptional regulator [Microvirga lenta]|uniref:helix-turn-helix transcriptional regulator n=1 Tax=Microvirga lenta TaxID=2881337 RepID=UPI001CFF9752|nr:AlpA family phage regulatory protein [Microvirga lenta]MCB5175544.1 AlpA family phage regulatory protein [Microvirga lenta]